MGPQGFSDSLPGFIRQRDGRIETGDVVIDMAADRSHSQQLVFEAATVFAHAQMQTEKQTLENRQSMVHRGGNQSGGFSAIGHHQHGGVPFIPKDRDQTS